MLLLTIHPHLATAQKLKPLASSDSSGKQLNAVPSEQLSTLLAQLQDPLAGNPASEIDPLPEDLLQEALQEGFKQAQESRSFEALLSKLPSGGSYSYNHDWGITEWMY